MIHQQYRPITVILALGLAALSAFANGTRLPSQDALAVARGYAFTATADNPSAIYYNPAGITQIADGEVSAGSHFLSVGASYSGAGGSTDMKSKTFVLPSLFATQPIGTGRFVLGVAAYAPFGTQTEWPTNGPFALVATDNKVQFIRYALTGAYKVSDQVSVGASVQYNSITADLHRGIGLSPGDDFGFHGTDNAPSANFGIRYQPDSNNSFGIQYQTQTVFHVDGMTKLTPYGVNEPGSVGWNFPDNLSIGYSYRPNSSWNMEVGYDLTMWSKLKTLTLNRPVTGPLYIPFNWKDSAYYGLGATYYSGPIHYSAGVNYSLNSVPDQWFSPSVPDFTRLLFNFGVGYKGQHWGLESVVQLSPNTSRTIAGSKQSSPYETVDGTYRGNLTGFTLQGSYRW